MNITNEQLMKWQDDAKTLLKGGHRNCQHIHIKEFLALTSEAWRLKMKCLVAQQEARNLEDMAISLVDERDALRVRVAELEGKS